MLSPFACARFCVDADTNPQTLLFSATCPPWVYDVAKKYMRPSCKHVDLIGKKTKKTATTVEVSLCVCGWRRWFICPRACRAVRTTIAHFICKWGHFFSGLVWWLRLAFRKRMHLWWWWSRPGECVVLLGVLRESDRHVFSCVQIWIRGGVSFVLSVPCVREKT